MKNIRQISDEATEAINGLLEPHLNEKQAEQVREIVEKAVVRGLLEGQHRAVDAALMYPEADQDLAHKIAAEIRRKNDLLIANLSSMR